MNYRLFLKSGFFSALVAIVFACGNKTSEQTDTSDSNAIPNLNYKIVGEMPHDINSFTEGFFVDNGQIYESTGSPEELPQTQSHIGILDSASGKINPKVTLDKKIYFGEGITILNGKMYQLTYKNQKCFVYDDKTFKKIGEYPYQNAEGWGITNNGKELIMSDGSFKLTYINPENFSKIKEITVTENGYATDKINELEYVNGFIYANVWTTNLILKIDAKSGVVVAKTDMGQLYLDAQKSNPNLMEMNGIAYDPAKKIFLITGKMWPKIYKVQM